MGVEDSVWLFGWLHNIGWSICLLHHGVGVLEGNETRFERASKSARAAFLRLCNTAKSSRLGLTVQLGNSVRTWGLFLVFGLHVRIRFSLLRKFSGRPCLVGVDGQNDRSFSGIQRGR